MYETVFLTRQEPEAWDPSDGDVVDLHGYSAAVAKAAIRSGLKRLLRRFLTAGERPSIGLDPFLATYYSNICSGSDKRVGALYA